MYFNSLAVDDFKLAFIASLAVVENDFNFKSCIVFEEAMCPGFYSQNEFFVSSGDLIAMTTKNLDLYLCPDLTGQIGTDRKTVINEWRNGLLHPHHNELWLLQRNL